MALGNTSIDWREVLSSYGIDKRFLSNRHGPCPVCGGKDRFRFDDRGKSGSFYCNRCGAGNGLTLLKLFTGKPVKDLLKEIGARNFCGFTGRFSPVRGVWNAGEDPVTPEKREENRRLIEETWDSSLPLTGSDPVSVYLKRRIPGIDIAMVSGNIRFHPRLAFVERSPLRKTVTYFPAMVAKVVSAKGQTVTLHRTYLTDKGSKAPVTPNKKLMPAASRLLGAGILLNSSGEQGVLALTEGIETGLAVMTAFKGKMNVRSQVSCGNLAVSDAGLMDGIRRVIIFADHDEPGLVAARTLYGKLSEKGFAVFMRKPFEPGLDFADVWLSHTAGSPYAVTGGRI